MEIYRKYFGEKLEVALRQANISQAELGQSVGVNASAVSRWVTGRDTPTEKNFKRILKALKLEAEYFLGKEGPNNQGKSLPDAVELLSLFAAQSPSRQKLLLALLKRDGSLFQAPNSEVSRAFQILLKS